MKPHNTTHGVFHILLVALVILGLLGVLSACKPHPVSCKPAPAEASPARHAEDTQAVTADTTTRADRDADDADANAQAGASMQATSTTDAFYYSDAAQASNTVSAVLQRFTEQRKEQLQRLAESLGIKVPAAFDMYLEAVKGNDWNVASNMYEQLRLFCGQYADSVEDAEIRTPLWQAIMEIHWAWEYAHAWGPVGTLTYVQELYKPITENSLYLGGTDPGRFLATAFQSEVARNGIAIMTQNALADNNYIKYASAIALQGSGAPANLTQAEFRKGYADYAKEVEQRRANGETVDGITIAGGKITVYGIAEVMRVNSILARTLWEKNKDAHDVFVEESFVVPWMYEYLEPAGPIMKLSRGKSELTSDKVNQDSAYWDSVECGLVPHVGDPLNLTFAKMRSAIAGLYENRNMLREAEHAYQQAVRLAPAAAEPSVRYAAMLANVGRYDEAHAIVNECRRFNPDMQKLADFNAQLDQIQKQKQKQKQAGH